MRIGYASIVDFRSFETSPRGGPKLLIPAEAVCASGAYWSYKKPI